MTSRPSVLAELRHLVELAAPTGFEEPVLDYVQRELRYVCPQVEVDVRGNVYGIQPGTDPAAPRVMITAHADEIGFIITQVLLGGFLRFTRLGFPTEQVLPGQRVHVLSTTGHLAGVIGVKPGHILSPEQARQVPPLSSLYIDIGATTPEEVADWGVEVGTPVVFVGELIETRHPGRFFGKAVDNRMGVACVLQIARALSQQSLPATRCYAIVVEEEIGLRGAAVAAKHLDPDVVLAIDTVPAGGTPELARDELSWEIGQGPLLKVLESKGLVTHRPLRELLRKVAHANNIPYQLIVDTAGITDATSAQQASGKIAAAVLGLARRYSHSAVEMFDLCDVERLIAWVVATLPELSSVAALKRV